MHSIELRLRHHFDRLVRWRMVQTLIQSDWWLSATARVPLENHRTLAVPLDP